MTKEYLDTAKAGKEIVGQTVGSITNLAGSVEDTSKKIEGLGDSGNSSVEEGNNYVLVQKEMDL